MICLLQHVEEELGMQRGLTFFSRLFFFFLRGNSFLVPNNVSLGIFEDIMQIGNLSLLSSCDYARNGP